MNHCRKDIVDAAATLAERLRDSGTRVTRSTWSSLIAGFMGTPRRDLASLKAELLRLLAALLKGQGGHLQRGESFKAQVFLAEKELRWAFQEWDYDLDAFRQLFGWTGRLLLLQDRPHQPGPKAAGHAPDQSQKPGRTSPGGGFGLNDKALEALKKLR